MRLVSPHRSLMFAPVTGTVDATYTNTWLTNGQANFPIRRTGDVALTVSPAATQACDVFAVCHHNIPAAATIALTDDVTNTIPTAAYPADGIPHNWFQLLDEAVNIDDVILGITGHSDPVYIGEFYAGLSWQPECGLRAGRQLDPGQVLALLGEFGMSVPYDSGVAMPRAMRGELALTDAEFTELLNIRAAQRNGLRPCLFIPDDDVNDAWLCQVRFTEQMTGGTHYVSIEILEIPRVRWP